MVAWLTIRTGGLEAAIAIHAVGNVVAFRLLAIVGECRARRAPSWSRTDSLFIRSTRVPGGVAAGESA